MNQDWLRVHSLETFGVHDGPGIRMVIFLQGCQFQCVYCANPDTMAVDGGECMTVEELVQKAVAEKPYFRGKGGVTVSGGEPLIQRGVLKRLFERLHEEGIHTALDSNGRLLDAQAKAVLAETDLLLLDVKHIDSERHRAITGLSNDKTLETAAYREASQKPFWLRYVLVPGWSDDPQHLHQLGAHFANFAYLQQIDLLPYHQFGMHKWEALGKEYALKNVQPPTAEQLATAQSILQQYVSRVNVN